MFGNSTDEEKLSNKFRQPLLMKNRFLRLVWIGEAVGGDVVKEVEEAGCYAAGFG